ncbi:SRPBCC family protein [Verrucomicrobium spinosum]|uniref:SRPBCC family protein n=1 Tax=Verrucomicrobium spinosum TaxID=2736 RepID=UPI0001744409|nr:SRPBCC domain-containing protein [Verrucomicrobium spinosum]
MPVHQPPLEVQVIRRYPHPVALVYQAWADPEHLTRWFRPYDDVTLEIVEHDLREGGEYVFHFTWPQAKFLLRGKYLTVQPMACLIFTWMPEPPDIDAGKDTMVSVFFRPLSDHETEVEVRHTLFPDEAMRARHEGCWNSTLDQLLRRL